MNKLSRGARMKAAILADMDSHELDPDARELEQLDVAAAAADRIERLEAVIAESGETFIQKGVTRPSPLLAEVRQQQTIMTRALNCLGLQNPDEPERDAAGRNLGKVRAGQASAESRRRRKAMMMHNVAKLEA
jgi:hypothetical protein